MDIKINGANFIDGLNTLVLGYFTFFDSGETDEVETKDESSESKMFDNDEPKDAGDDVTGLAEFMESNEDAEKKPEEPGMLDEITKPIMDSAKLGGKKQKKTRGRRRKKNRSRRHH